MQAFLVAVALCGQLTAPLDDAACLYRAQQPVAGMIPNEGTRTEPLVLSGPDYINGVDGPLLRFVRADTDSALAMIPPEVTNGSVTLAVRYRPSDQWNARFLWGIIDGPASTPLKRCMIYTDTGNKYYARFFLESGGYDCVTRSTTTTSTTRFDTISVVWDDANATHSLYVNGLPEDSRASPGPKQLATEDGVYAPYPSSQLAAGGDFQAWAIWSRALSAQENAALVISDDWYAEGGEPIPPPMGQLIVKINGTTQPAGTTVKIDGIVVQPPLTGEKIIEVETP